MKVREALTDYLEAKKEFEEYRETVVHGEYSPWLQKLSDKADAAAERFDWALESLIADRIESATGARP